MGKSNFWVSGSLPIAVHPHTCGEIPPPQWGRVNCCGSPPHVWGNQSTGQWDVAYPRFTPTRVGKSDGWLDAINICAVHPHTCGEICPCRGQKTAAGGSPPHVWGNLVVRAVDHPPRRFTPTRVGKSRPVIVGVVVGAVHPHTCGEILIRPQPRQSKNGSPPHVWGNLHNCVRMTAFPRFTPTRVGKSCSCCHLIALRAVHPHTCGEIR